MILKFKTKTEAAAYLKETGYSWDGYGHFDNRLEIYKAGPLVAILRKVPFKGFSINIR